MTQPLTDTFPAFRLQQQEGQFVRLVLPVQDPMTDAWAQALPAAEVTVFHQQQDSRALDNALRLLGTLYDHGVTSPQVLKIILTATGHTRKTPDANTDQPQARSEGAPQPAPAE